MRSSSLVMWCSEAKSKSICAGSSTQTRKWGYHEYTITDWKLAGLRRVFDSEAGAFRDADTFDLELPNGPRSPA